MKLKILSLLLLATKSYASDAIVIVLQTPFFKEPSYTSKVMQVARKGERVYVPNEIAATHPLPEFIPSFDKVGNNVFIPTRFIKIITNDEVEYLTSINHPNHDPTDYRLEEPIPHTYPFTTNSFLKASFSFTIGNNVKSPYTYNRDFNGQDFAPEKGARILITRRVSFDKYDRFYFGTYLNISSCRNFFEFSTGESATEKRSMFRIGPYLSYDTFSGRDIRVTLGTGFTYNYHKTSVQFSGINQSAEERFFTGFSLSPLVSAYIQVENYFPNFDLIAGTDINFYFDRDLKAENKAAVPELWPTESIKEELKPQASLYIGAQFKY